jgi:hypothetical protein
MRVLGESSRTEKDNYSQREKRKHSQEKDIGALVMHQDLYSLGIRVRGCTR